MLEQLSAHFLPVFARIQLGVLIVSSIIATVGLWLAPLPTLRNADPAVVKTIAVGSVAVFGALLPVLVAVLRGRSRSAMRRRPLATLLVFVLGGLAHAFVLSPLLATPVQAAFSFIGMVAGGFLAIAQIAELQRGIQSREPKSKL
jgi:hypothetical protein